MRLALIEIGSRATRLLIVDVQKDGTVTIVKKARKEIALGLAVGMGREAVTERLTEVTKQCRLFEQEANIRGARIVCFGTEALRKIREEGSFNLKQLKAAVLDANMEAECSFWAAAKD